MRVCKWREEKGRKGASGYSTVDSLYSLARMESNASKILRCIEAANGIAATLKQCGENTEFY